MTTILKPLNIFAFYAALLCTCTCYGDQPKPEAVTDTSTMAATVPDTLLDDPFENLSNFKRISTLKELEVHAAQSGQRIKMEPGVYQLADILSDAAITSRRELAAKDAGSKRASATLFRFEGSNNLFDLTGVTIEVDTKLLSVFKGCYIREFLIAGHNNAIKGITIRDIGNFPTSRGGNSLTVNGNDTHLQDITLHVSGSFPYGYGDYLGKGKNSIVSGQKHSGLLICGTHTELLRCQVITRAFGHAFFIQGGINTIFEDCDAEGEMRATDDMLAETSGPAFENHFAMMYKPKVIQPGYMKSLNECGFRTYGSGGPTKRKTGKVTLIRCTAKNVRVGFALSANDETDPVLLEACTAIGCERGYYLQKAITDACKGDAKYGPLLYLVGDEPSTIDLQLLPETSEMNVHAVATISGQGHSVNITATDTSRNQLHPILLGYCPPGGGEISTPIPEAYAANIKLQNETTMPIIIGSKAENCIVETTGPVKRNDGKQIEFVQSRP